MDQQLAGVHAILRLGILRDEVFARLAAARHHTDIVAAHQRVEARDARQRRFRRHQPELGIFAQRLFHVALDARLNLNGAVVVAQIDALHGADLHALIANRRAARHDAVRRLEVNGYHRAALFIVGPEQPAGDQHGDDRQKPEWRNLTFAAQRRVSRCSRRFLLHVHPKAGGCRATQRP